MDKTECLELAKFFRTELNKKDSELNKLAKKKLERIQVTNIDAKELQQNYNFQGLTDCFNKFPTEVEVELNKGSTDFRIERRRNLESVVLYYHKDLPGLRVSFAKGD